MNGFICAVSRFFECILCVNGFAVNSLDSVSGFYAQWVNGFYRTTAHIYLEPLPRTLPSTGTMALELLGRRNKNE